MRITQAIRIILLAGFASGAEFEVNDRISVDGFSVFRSTGAITGNVGVGTIAVSGMRLAVIGDTGTAYSRARLTRLLFQRAAMGAAAVRQALLSSNIRIEK